ncbi:unnamed protein product [Somion occarium]|uniref:BTB domain-containing protein n=1 Tax=Somion occarium TaxID=3059160 RepID=A0ABP1CQ66_9APHY
MQGVIAMLKYPLRPLRKNQPLQVFAIACRFGFEELAREAASIWRTQVAPRGSVNQHPSVEWPATTLGVSYVDEMAPMRAGSYLRFLKFLRDGRSIKGIYFPSADIVVRSCQEDGVRFKVHQLILSLSSPLLEKEISGLDRKSGDLPVLFLPEKSSILNIIIGSCYPSVVSDLTDMSIHDISALITSAAKYQLKTVLACCRRQTQKMTVADPFHAYSIAVQHGWREEARYAAIRIARLQQEENYSSTMECLDTRFYYPLLKFCHQYRKILSYLAADHEPTYWSQANWLWDDDDDAKDLAWVMTIQAAKSTVRCLGNSSYRGTSAREAIDILQSLKDNIRSALIQLQLEVPWAEDPTAVIPE